MTSYRLTRRADQDLGDIYAYTLENFGFAQAERMLTASDRVLRCWLTIPAWAEGSKPSGLVFAATNMVYM